jgi:peptidoglycan/LPS O-acetylase OafA/YrhL
MGDRRYVPELDGLRAVAIIVVVLWHASRDHPVQGGFLGVDLFFVLSAFLITGLLVSERNKTGRIRFVRFYVRRLLRLTPALLLMLAAYLAVAPFVWPREPHLGDALLTATYVSNYSTTFWGRPAHLGHSWSLAVEEQFYLVWPLAILLLSRVKQPVIWLGAMFCALIAWRLSFANFHDYYYRFDTHSTGLVLGAILFFALPRMRLRPVHAYASALTFLVCVAVGRLESARDIIPMAELCSFLLIGCAATGQLGALTAVLRCSPMVAVGRWSYGIYLWHYPIATAVREHFGFWTTVGVTLASATLLAAISYSTVERAGRNLRQWLERRAEKLPGPDPALGTI